MIEVELGLLEGFDHAERVSATSIIELTGCLTVLATSTLSNKLYILRFM